MANFSNDLGDIYHIKHHSRSITKHNSQYEVQSPPVHNHQTFLLLWSFVLLNHTLIRVVSSIITVSAFCCSYFVLYLAQECQAAVTLLLSETCLFVLRMEDNYDFHVGKKPTLWHRINNIENRRQSFFKLSNLFSADESLGLAFSLKRGSISFVTGSFNEEGI